jgi:hypothetical protein
MAMAWRQLTAAEQTAMDTGARSRTAPARAVARARIMLLARAGQRGPARAQALALPQLTVRPWLRRFHAAGREGVRDRPRAGRPALYQPAPGAAVRAASLSAPPQLGLPSAGWTSDRLAAERHAGQKSPSQRRRSAARLSAAGRRWATPAPWCGARAAPECAPHRGAGQRATPNRLRRGR